MKKALDTKIMENHNGEPPKIVVFTKTEEQLLITAFAEAQNSVSEVQKAQEVLQQKRDVMIVTSGSVDKIYKTIMTLKGVNPDAFQLSLDQGTHELKLVPVGG
jgi:hypothetical protein